MENFLILRIHLNSLMNKSDTGHNYRWAKIMKKFHLLIFKYIKLNSKWGFLILLPNHESLWVIRTYPSTLRLESTLIPFVLCELMTEECMCYRKTNCSSALYWVLQTPGTFVSSLAAVKIVTPSLVPVPVQPPQLT